MFCFWARSGYSHNKNKSCGSLCRSFLCYNQFSFLQKCYCDNPEFGELLRGRAKGFGGDPKAPEKTLGAMNKALAQRSLFELLALFTLKAKLRSKQASRLFWGALRSPPTPPSPYKLRLYINNKKVKRNLSIPLTAFPQALRSLPHRPSSRLRLFPAQSFP